MNAVRDHDPRHFLERTIGFLEADEASNLLALGIIIRLSSGDSPPPVGRQPLLLAVEEGARVRAVCVITPPLRLILSCPDDADRSVIHAACRNLIENRTPLPGVVGPPKATELFAARWAEETGCSPAVNMRQMIHRLDAVNDVAIAPGELVVATAEHVPLIADWLVQFAKITPEEMTRPKAQVAAREAVAASRVYLWMCPQPVSMVAQTRPTRHGIALSWVYTPPPLRRKGYATSVVAALSRRLLAEGYDFCTLYTDLANPTSNRIYHAIGYVPIQEAVVYDFET